MARFRRRPTLGIYSGKNTPNRVGRVSDSARPFAALGPPPPVSSESMGQIAGWYERVAAKFVFSILFGAISPLVVDRVTGVGLGAGGDE